MISEVLEVSCPIRSISGVFTCIYNTININQMYVNIPYMDGMGVDFLRYFRINVDLFGLNNC